MVYLKSNRLSSRFKVQNKNQDSQTFRMLNLLSKEIHILEEKIPYLGQLISFKANIINDFSPQTKYNQVQLEARQAGIGFFQTKSSVQYWDCRTAKEILNTEVILRFFLCMPIKDFRLSIIKYSCTLSQGNRLSAI